MSGNNDMITTAPGDLLGAGPSYDPRCSMASAEHAVAAYLPPKEYESLAKRSGFDGSTMISVGGTQAGISWSPEAIIFASRGSSERSDWRDDAASCKVPWPGILRIGQTTRGFRRHSSRIVYRAAETIAELKQQEPLARVVLTGHSLGATPPPFLALILRSWGVRVDAVYCHAMPRAMDRPGALWYDGGLRSRTFRVVVVHRGRQDLVTRIPPSRWGFWHIGTPEIIEDGVRYESEERWERIRSYRTVRWWEPFRIVTRTRRGIRAHFGGTLLETLRLQVKLDGQGFAN